MPAHAASAKDAGSQAGAVSHSAPAPSNTRAGWHRQAAQVQHDVRTSCLAKDRSAFIVQGPHGMRACPRTLMRSRAPRSGRPACTSLSAALPLYQNSKLQHRGLYALWRTCSSAPGKDRRLQGVRQHSGRERMRRGAGTRTLRQGAAARVRGRGGGGGLLGRRVLARGHLCGRNGRQRALALRLGLGRGAGVGRRRARPQLRCAPPPRPCQARGSQQRPLHVCIPQTHAMHAGTGHALPLCSLRRVATWPTATELMRPAAAA
jgi:hypothetical protein